MINKMLIFALMVFTLPFAALAQERETPPFKVETIADGLDHPWSVAFLPQGGYLVSEREGKLIHINPNGEKKEITGLPDIYSRGQGGLLDLALHPEFEDNSLLYFSYAAADDNNRNLANTEVARTKLDLNNHQLNNVETFFTALPKVRGNNHWGSRLLFHPDGHLYITLGERFDYREEAQNIENHLGKVVRLNWDGSIPQDNPFVGQANAKPEIYSYGHRNAQGIALHPETGEVWVHEHGPKGGDEINILKAGANYGWPKVSYGKTYGGRTISEDPTAEGITDPVLQWTPSIAPSGMAFYTGDQFEDWNGDLFVGALVLRHLRHVDLNGSDIVGQDQLLKDMNKRIRDVRQGPDQGPDGALYILTDDNNGELLRLVK